MAQDGFDVRYIILRPVEQTAVLRAVKRGGETLTDAETVRYMWRAFADLGLYEPHAIDTTTQNIDHVMPLRIRTASKGLRRYPPMPTAWLL
jgi:hypothetical protein